jgi:S-adenosylmethionine synthetase
MTTLKGEKMASEYLFTSESVTEGHPDKIADQVSDAILDAILAGDKNGRVACETLVTTGLVFVAGEITTDCYVDVPAIVRRTVREAGYTNPEYGFDYKSCGVITAIQEQSPDIALGVDTGGAGDQGMMFGYATRETPELMPLDYLRPDGKVQVTVRYDDGEPKEVKTVVLSAHHSSDVDMKRVRDDTEELVIRAVMPEKLLAKDAEFLINPTGRFEVGGPQGDTGVTGRKIIMDTYGGVGSHGGGCFSGKDPTKVDRSASYAARYVARTVVAAGIAEKCEIQIAYAIGVAEPVSLMVNTLGTGKMPEKEIVKLIRKNFDLSPGGIIKMLDLLRPIYKKTAVYGHFGRSEEEFTWEKEDRVELLRKEAKL